MAEQSFVIKIDLPGSSQDADDGLEWIMIENLVSYGGAHSAKEFIVMKVQAVTDPKKSLSELAHFSKEISISTFIVRRDGLMLSAGEHGLNQTPNNKEADPHDTIRNTSIALMGHIGLSGTQR